MAGAVSVAVAFHAAKPEYGPKKCFCPQGCSGLLLYHFMQLARMPRCNKVGLTWYMQMYNVRANTAVHTECL